MKKLALTIAIVLGLSFGAFAQGGMFQYGATPQGFGAPAWFAFGGQNLWGNDFTGTNPLLPQHGQDTNQNAPLGSGLLLLAGMGAAYAAAKRRKE
ncbi:MAG: hypothetical protein K6F96_04485 [Bacteroidales bacterium]|nr:hypothetical protein [Bacteroidales bacterium]